MEKNEAIILAVTTGTMSQAEAARRFQVSRSWVSKLVARYRAVGEAAFTPGSRTAHHHPNAIPRQRAAHSHPGRAHHPRPRRTPPRQLAQLQRGPAQPAVAGRLHPLVPGRSHRRGDPDLPRRPLPLRDRLHRTPRHHRPTPP
ncbi:hypothetical protein E1J17_18155, partial [Kocuria rosea]